MGMKLEQLKPKPDALIRRFYFPPDADAKNGIRVTVQYLSPSVISEVEQQYRISSQRDGKRIEDIAPADLRRALVHEVLLKAVIKCEDVTLGKLRNYVPLSAEAVAENGGLDAAVSLDPSTGADGRANLLYLLEHSQEFSQWVQGVIGNLRLFQSADWEERAKNSGAGVPSSTAATQS
jgi:hypothetical protein